jgi:hypothetical protein
MAVIYGMAKEYPTVAGSNDMQLSPHLHLRCPLGTFAGNKCDGCSVSRCSHPTISELHKILGMPLIKKLVKVTEHNTSRLYGGGIIIGRGSSTLIPSVLKEKVRSIFVEQLAHGHGDSCETLLHAEHATGSGIEGASVPDSTRLPSIWSNEDRDVAESNSSLDARMPKDELDAGPQSTTPSPTRSQTFSARVQ